MRYSPLRRLRAALARRIGIHDLRARLDNHDQRIKKLNLSLRDTTKNWEHRAATDEQRTRDFALSAATGSATEVSKDVANRLISLNEALVAHISKATMDVEVQAGEKIRSLELQLAKAERSIDHLRSVEGQLVKAKREIDNLRRLIGSAAGSASTPTIATDSFTEAVIDPSFYVTIEDAFRGEQELVIERQSAYLPLFRSKVKAESPLLDLGCGRGEWLELLRKENLAASGIDSNVVCVAECREKGLDVQQADLLGHLRLLPEGSLGAVTLFQVLEHLPFMMVIDVMREIRRVLVSGGIMLAEVPNAKNARVASGTFWIDPTHNKPLYPDFLEFLADMAGFSEVQGLYVNPLSPTPDLGDIGEGLRKAVTEAFEAIYGPADYALVAHA